MYDVDEIPYCEKDENEQKIEIPNEPTIIGSEQLKELIDKAGHNQVPVSLPLAYLCDSKPTDDPDCWEPECYAQMCLREAYLPFLTMPSNIDLRETIFDGAQLQGAQFPNAHLTDASLRDISAPGLKADGARMERVNLMSANLIGASFVGTQLPYAKMDSIKLIQANLTQANLDNAKLPWGQLNNVFAKGTNFTEADLSAVNAEGATFIQCDFTGASLAHTNLTDAILKDCDLTGTDMSLTNLLGIKVGQDSKKAYAMLSHANWENVRRALFLLFTRYTEPEKSMLVSLMLRQGKLPEVPLWEALGLDKPLTNEGMQRMDHNPLLVAQFFLNAFYDIEDDRYNKRPFVQLLNKWFEDFEKVLKPNH